jgi:hypothetical protein
MCKNDGENMKYLKISSGNTGRSRRSREDRNKLNLGKKNGEFQFGVK